MYKKVVKKPNFKLVAKDPTSENTNIHKRGNTMVEKRIRRITPVRIKFNLERDLKEFNVREETEILLKKLWEGDESIKVGSVVNKDMH